MSTLKGFAACSLGETQWDEVDRAYGSHVAFDDSGITPAWQLDIVRAAYSSGIDYLTKGSLDGARRSRDYLAQTAAQIGHGENKSLAFDLVADLADKIDSLSPQAVSDLRDVNTRDTGFIQQGVANRNEEAEKAARRERCYQMAAQRYGSLANIPGFADFLCDWQGYISKAKWAAVAVVGGVVAFKVLPLLKR